MGRVITEDTQAQEIIAYSVFFLTPLAEGRTVYLTK